jgi:hypothetical protein
VTKVKKKNYENRLSWVIKGMNIVIFAVGLVYFLSNDIDILSGNRENLVSAVDSGYFISSTSMEHGYEGYKAKMASVDNIKAAVADG